jgi:peptidoglycan LD-endopeptidase CwlK
MKWYYWLGFGLGLMGIAGYAKRKEIMEAWDDYVTNTRIEKLHPAIRSKVREFINEAARRGIFLRITSGLRTFGEQAELYAQGRTKPGKIVTNARPGSSFHNYALAFDVVEMKDGKGLWENPNWDAIGQLGKSLGFEWGGDWTSFKDLPHFQYPPKTSVSSLLAHYNAGHKDSEGYLKNIA